MKKTISLLAVIFIFYLLSFIIHPYAEATYVLPYPSYMPGNKAYKVSRIIDTISFYWYRGNIAQVKYHLNLSDKYLVESKTLFEYKQYLLGVDALRRSSEEFQKLPRYVAGGEGEHKDMTSLISLIHEAGKEHVRVLERMQEESPAEFRWTPEKTSPSDLSLHSDIQQAIAVIQIVSETIQK